MDWRNEGRKEGRRRPSPFFLTPSLLYVAQHFGDVSRCVLFLRQRLNVLPSNTISKNRNFEYQNNNCRKVATQCRSVPDPLLPIALYSRKCAVFSWGLGFYKPPLNLLLLYIPNSEVVFYFHHKLVFIMRYPKRWDGCMWNLWRCIIWTGRGRGGGRYRSSDTSP